MSIYIKKAQFTLCAVSLWFLVCFAVAARAQSNQTDTAIIYEYQTITQKKGESFSAFLDTHVASAVDKKIINDLPILHNAVSDRQFRLSYTGKGDTRHLQAIHVSRGKRVINFVLTDINGKKRFVQQAQVPLILQSVEDTKSSKNTDAKIAENDLQQLDFYSVIQKKGQDFKQALKPVKLTKKQQRIIETGDFSRFAKSDRTISIYYLSDDGKRSLKGLRIVRNDIVVEYLVQKKGREFFLVDIKLLGASQRANLHTAFQNAVVKNKTTVSHTHTPRPVELISDRNNDIGIHLTQPKGQSFDNAIKPAKLSKVQRRIILAANFVKLARSKRQIIIFFEKDNTNRLLKGMRLIRDKIIVDYAVKKVGKTFVLVNLKTLDEQQHSRLKQLFSSIKPIKIKPTKPPVKLVSAKSVQYVAKQFNQHKGQSLEKACAVAKLSKLQQRIINTGDFVKTARSIRQITTFYEVSGKKWLLKGLRVSRNDVNVDYFVKRVASVLRLVNLKTLPKSEAAVIRKNFRAAKITRLKTKAGKIALSSTEVVGKKSKSSSVSTVITKRSQGKYKVITSTQQKSQTLYSAIKNAGLSSVQRQLVIDMPANQSAKTTRKIHLLFEKEGDKQYMRAMRIVRGNSVAEYVVTKNKGKLVWANDKGQVNTAGRFTRYPVKFSRVSSGFNLRRRHPVTRRLRPHRGIDLKAPHGAPVYAPASGIVKFSGRQRGYGIILEIDHQNGYRTKYAHLSRIMRSARKGKYIKKGQLIAKVGNTGISTGTHLHYEILVNGVARNPRTVKLPGGGGKKILATAQVAVKKYLPILRKLSR